MTRTSQEQLKNKFALVYEFNKQSPLFVRAAETEIDASRFHSAIEILTEGLKKFPEYATAYIMLGKAYTRLGEYEKAEDAYVKGCDLLHSKKTLTYYINELEKIKRVDLLYLASKRIPFIPENFERVISDEDEEHQDAVEVTDEEILMDTDSFKEEEKIEIPDAEEPEITPQAEPLESRLEHLADELSAAKIIVDENKTEPDNTPQPPKPEEEIITETLAKILLSQGKFHEALDVYRKLCIKIPEKAPYFKAKIVEIESQIDFGW